MSDEQRLFVAIRPPSTICDDLADAIADLHVGAVPRRPEAPWHITTTYIGTAPPGDADAAVAAACAATAPLRLGIAGAGRFGRGRYSVVWAGVDGDVAALHDHVARLRRELAARGVPYDARRYRPHLTLAGTSARIDNSRSAADLVSLRSYQGPRWTVTGCVLYTVDAAHGYRELARHAFTG